MRGAASPRRHTLLGLAPWLITLAGCVSSPRAASELAHGSETIAFTPSIAASMLTSEREARDRNGPRVGRSDISAETLAGRCQADGCAEPSSPVPVIHDHQVDLALPDGYRLRDVLLELRDRERARGTHRVLVSELAAAPGVTISEPAAGVARLRFDLALWKPGLNRFVVRAHATRGSARRALPAVSFRIRYAPPRTLGLAAAGSFQLPAEMIPHRMRDCAGPSCKDADRDGLNDLWENLVIEQLRPHLLLDGADAIFSQRRDSIRVLSSLSPLARDDRELIVIASVVAFSRDYGYFGLFGHAGDTEAFGMLYAVEPGGRLRWLASTAKGHACLTCPPRYEQHRQDFAADGVPLVYVERDKHGLWQNGKQCRTRAGFRCRGDRSLRPPVTNVGDYSPDGSRGLIDTLDGVAPDGSFGELAGVFPGDAVWSTARSRVPGRFCGGMQRCNRRNSANLPGRVITKIVSELDASVR